MIVLVIAVTLALPAALNLIVKNAAAVSRGWDNALDFSVFLEQEVSLEDARRLATLIEERADVASVQLIPADEALAEFKARSGFGDALDQLGENPLPHTLVVRPSPDNTGASIGLLREELENLPETELVQVDTEWVQRFHAILDIVRQGIFIGSVLLAAAIVVIIGNTIRLDIQNRREEIEVTKLIGASNGFVRRPFLWTGLWYGLFGGLLAIGLVLYGLYLLQAPIARLAGLYHSDIKVLSFDPREIGTILGIGIGLGLVGSWFAVARHLRRIEPR
jgi:cell division transport system permease protein